MRWGIQSITCAGFFGITGKLPQWLIGNGKPGLDSSHNVVFQSYDDEISRGKWCGRHYDHHLHTILVEDFVYRFFDESRTCYQLSLRSGGRQEIKENI